MTGKSRQNQSLIWVYPPDSWYTTSNKTFVYGYADPNKKLFVSSDEYLVPERIKIFPNGNFARSIKLPDLTNNIKLIQMINGKRKILTRTVITRNKVTKQSQATTSLRGAKRQSNLSNVMRLPRAFSPRNDIVIVIDPGHGGSEHGTHSPKGIPEKIFNLQIAKLLYRNLSRVILQYDPTCHVYMTRTTDKFVSLKQRVLFAKKKKCNILISIHHNALPDSEDPLKHSGIGIYHTHDFVKPLAKTLLDSISKEAYLKRYGIFKRDFVMTRVTFCYAVLIECGFLIHPVESEYITKPETQKKIVNGIIKGLKASRLLK